MRKNLSELFCNSCPCRLSLGHTKTLLLLCLVCLDDLSVSMQPQHARSENHRLDRCETMLVLQVEEVDALTDPCPLPSTLKKRGLNERERLLYAPMADVGGLLYDKDAVYIDIPDWKVSSQPTVLGLPLQMQWGFCLRHPKQSSRTHYVEDSGTRLGIASWVLCVCVTRHMLTGDLTANSDGLKSVGSVSRHLLQQLYVYGHTQHGGHDSPCCILTLQQCPQRQQIVELPIELVHALPVSGIVLLS